MSEKAEALAAWVADYVAETSRDENVDAFVAHVDQAILGLTPELAADPVLTDELHASTKAHFRAFLSLLERTGHELLLPPQASDVALSIARRNLELGVLLKVYRAQGPPRFVAPALLGVLPRAPESGPITILGRLMRCGDQRHGRRCQLVSDWALTRPESTASLSAA